MERNAVRESENRTPKSEGNPKAGIRTRSEACGQPTRLTTEYRENAKYAIMPIKLQSVPQSPVSDFEVRRSFGPRISALGFLLAFCLSAAAAAKSAPSPDRTSVVLVVGAPGEPAYASNFVQQAEQWKKACARASCSCITLGLDSAAATSDCELLQQTLATEPKDGLGQLWLVFIGHGTSDGREARFNLRGPDVSATELGQWLQPFRRPLAFVDTSSASGPFLNKLSGTNRIIITATRSGREQNYARFGKYFAEAISNPEADLDKDGQVSLLEAFLSASRQTAEFYKVEGRIQTEHALLDDNGDGLGTPADWFRGVRAVKKAKEGAALDGLLAQQFVLIPSEAERKLAPEFRARRDALERSVLLYRDKKGAVPEEQYYRELERLLLELARLYDQS